MNCAIKDATVKRFHNDSHDHNHISRRVAIEMNIHQTGSHRPVTDGQRVAVIYRRSVMLANGRYAMLDDGVGFSLVPWRLEIEPRLGQHITATVRGGVVSWEIGRQRGLSII